MPVRITKNSSGGYRVSTPNGVKARDTTLSKARAQARIINEADMGATKVKVGNYRADVDTTGMDPEMREVFQPVTPAAPKQPSLMDRAADFVRGMSKRMNSSGSHRSPTTRKDR